MGRRAIPCHRQGVHQVVIALDRLSGHTAFESLDVEENLGNVPLTRIEVPFVADDLPVLVAVRPPEEVELKRYRSGLKRDAQGQLQDATAVTNQIGRTCCVYPEPDVLKRLVAHFTTLDTQLGQETLALSRGKVHAEGKG